MGTMDVAFGRIVRLQGLPREKTGPCAIAAIPWRAKNRLHCPKRKFPILASMCGRRRSNFRFGVRVLEAANEILGGNG